MRIAIVCVLLAFCLVPAWTQSLSDDFGDGDFTSDPSWTGDTDQFIVNGSQQLQLQGNCLEGGTHYLSVSAATSDSTVWEFFATLDFDPSSSNQMRYYLKSDAADLNGPLQGYFIRIGQDGSGDAVSLYRQDGSSTTLLLQGDEGAVASSPVVRIRVIRSEDAVWQLWVDYTGGTSFTDEGSHTDDTYNTSYYAGVWCQYTSTRCDAFYFDDVYVSPLYVDTEPPVLLAATAVSSMQVKATFNEPLDPVSAENGSNYTIDGGVGNPLDASLEESGTEVMLTFADDLPSAVLLNLEVNDISDLFGNTCGLQSQPFTNYEPQLFDILITEIMADPDPAQELPAEEFLEIWNTTPFAISLEGWTVSDPGTQSDPFPAVELPAGGYLIICSAADVALFTGYGTVIGISSFPTLNNTTDSVYLYDEEERLMHSVYYMDDWYGDPIKQSGGFTLEMIDTNNPCQGADNWTGSDDPSGGTPGQLNSVSGENPDLVAPALMTVYPSDPAYLYITFSEHILTDGLDPEQFLITPDIGNPVDIEASENIGEYVGLSLPVELDSGITYTLTCSGIADCSGNVIGALNSREFGLPVTPDPGDLIINEILFNPYSGGYDFVEVYNNSAYFIQLNGIHLVERNTEDSLEILEYCSLGSYGSMLPPGAYYVITGDISGLQNDYYIAPDALYGEEAQCPNFPDDAGIVSLELKGPGTVIDQLRYDDNWHYPLLDDENGVSLERLRFDVPAQQQENWHSAAEDAGFATPGRVNSVASTFEGAAGSWILESEIFSPDGDGYQDLLVLTYVQPVAGTSASLSVFNLAGQLVAVPARNRFLGNEGLLTWDGLDENGKPAPTGIYILFIEQFDLSGQTAQFKLPVTLARRQ